VRPPRRARAGADVENAVEPGDVEDRAAFHGHALAVVSGAPAPNGQWDAVARGCRSDADHFGFVPGLEQDLTHVPVEEFRKDGRVPVIVLGPGLDVFGVVDLCNAFELETEGRKGFG
jgi:hypothetical protein